jgi:hypothetical protein
MLTLNDLIKMNNIAHENGKTPADIDTFCESLRWSRSKQDFQKVGDLPIFYVLRALLRDLRDKEALIDELETLEAVQEHYNNVREKHVKSIKFNKKENV